MVAQDHSSFHASKQPVTGQMTWASVFAGDGGGNEVEGFDTSSQSLAGKSGSSDVGGSDDPDQSISPVTESVVDDSVSPESNAASLSSTTEGIRDSEANKKVIVPDEAGIGKEVKEDGVDVEDKEVLDEKLVSYETEQEEIGDIENEKEAKGVEEVDGSKNGLESEERSLVGGKTDDDDDDDDKSDKVVEEEIVKLRDIIVDSSAIESLDVDVVDKTTLSIEETDDPSAPCDGDFGLDAKETSEAAKLEPGEKQESQSIEVKEVYEMNNAEEGDNVSTRAKGKEIDQGSSRKSSVGFHIYVSDEETEEIVFDEEVDTNDKDEEKTIDSAALSAFIKAVTSGYSDATKRVQFPAPRTNIFPNLILPMDGEESESNLSEEEKQKLKNLQTLRVKYLRLLHRLGQSIEDTIAWQILNRLALLAPRHSVKSFSLDTAKKTAMEFEAEGKEDLDFSLNILVLGKSGVGKSATINSIFGEQKATIDAFRHSTTSVREISGTLNGVKITIIDTPGLKTYAMDQSANSKILSSVKKVMKKCPPDIVLYVDRLDAQKEGSLNDLPLLKTITASLGSSIWTNAIVTLTHSSSAPPDGLNYEEFAMRCSDMVQISIGQALGLVYTNPFTQVSFVENHPLCRKNRDGEKILPNGLAWRSELLLLCYSRKIVSDAISLLKPQEPSAQHGSFFGSRIRFPPLSSLLSWLLQSHPHPKLPGDLEIDSDIDVSDSEDEYNQLPPFKPLRKSQLAKLSKEQKKAYFDEYDYRVKLLQKKELKRIKEMKKNNVNVFKEYEEEEEAATLALPKPDIVLPLTFDSDDSTYRYRCLEPTSSFVTKALLEDQGWDHDYGYDSVIADKSLTLAKRFPGSVTVQVTKDKKEFNIYLDSSVSAKYRGSSTMAKFLIQGSEEQLIYMLKGETKLKKTALGGSMTLLGNVIATGIKLEKEIALTKRILVFGNAGTTRSSHGDSVYEANLEVKRREADSFPIGQTESVLGMCLRKSKHDLTVTGNLRSQVLIGRGTKVAAFVSLDSKKSGRITVRTSTLDQLQIAVMAFLPIAMSLYKKVLGSRED